MSVILVEGGRKLSGAVTVQGAKNSVLPMLAVYLIFQRYFVEGMAGAVKG